MIQLIMIRDLTSSIWLEPNRRTGDAVWVQTTAAARHLIENGICKWPEAGPSETKPFEPSQRKSFADRTDGPSTDSASSNKHGPVKLSSASAAALVPHKRL